MVYDYLQAGNRTHDGDVPIRAYRCLFFPYSNCTSKFRRKLSYLRFLRKLNFSPSLRVLKENLDVPLLHAPKRSSPVSTFCPKFDKTFVTLCLFKLVCHCANPKPRRPCIFQYRSLSDLRPWAAWRTRTDALFRAENAPRTWR